MKKAQTVSEAVARYLTQNKDDVCSRQREHRLRVLNKFASEFGKVPIAELTAGDLKLWAEGLPGLKSGWSVRSWIAVVKACFNWCFQLGITDRQPFAKVQTKAGKRGRPLTDAEFQKIMRYAGCPLLRQFLTFLRYSGCRPGEAAKATWKDVKPEQNAIVLLEHKTAKKTGRPRVIYLHPVNAKLLAALYRVRKDDGMIFRNRHGGPWNNSVRSAHMVRIRKAAGIPKDAKIYGARHAFATTAILNGVPIKTLATLMGHATVVTTEIYTHIAGNHEHLSESIGEVFGKKRIA